MASTNLRISAPIRIQRTAFRRSGRRQKQRIHCCSAGRLQCGHGKCAPSFLPGSGHRKSRIPFQISCLGVPLVGGGLFSFSMGYPFSKPEFANVLVFLHIQPFCTFFSHVCFNIKAIFTKFLSNFLIQLICIPVLPYFFI